MKVSKKIYELLIWGILCIVTFGYEYMTSSEEPLTNIENDWQMATNNYETHVKVNEDGSYSVSETIDVNFINERHGIYRYIPYKGIMNIEDEYGNDKKMHYYSDIKLTYSNVEINSIINEFENVSIMFGNKESMFIGDNVYNFEYEMKPKMQENNNIIYYNIYPTGWKNDIPAGSTFTIEFPEKVSLDNLNLYYGTYGENNDALSIVDIEVNGNTLVGKLKTKLPVGNGLTLYMPVDEGYFTSINSIPMDLTTFNRVCIIIVILMAGLYFLFGRDEKIIKSVQFKAPKDLDSAAIGYIIDGNISDGDIISLIIYLADKGYLMIEKGYGKGDMVLVKKRSMGEEMPDYVRTIFNSIFNDYKKEKVEVSSLKYEFIHYMNKGKKQLRTKYSKKIYTNISKFNRFISLSLCCLVVPSFVITSNRMSTIYMDTIYMYLICLTFYIAGVILLSKVSDSWYSIKNTWRKISIIFGVIFYISGILGVSLIYLSSVNKGAAFSYNKSLIIAIASSVILLFFVTIMKKRTTECIELMGYLIGFKEFIEYAEVDRIKALAKEDPQWFYSVLPYAYVFGLSDVWIGKFKDVILYRPDWYSGRDGYDFSSFNKMLIEDLNESKSIFTSIKASKGSSSSSSSGHSGGGFGGGGGGSW